MADKLIIGVPSKGRLMDRTLEVFAAAGLKIKRDGERRGYLGHIEALGGAEVSFLSAAEIAQSINCGRVHLGVTGEDLIHEQISDLEARVSLLKALGFGRADVVVAVPTCWIDVSHVSDLEDTAERFRKAHGRRLRVATKYLNLTRRFFAEHGVTGYRIVESLGATEGTPAAGTADLVVDITSTGATLAANNLKVLADGVILKSQAILVASKGADWSGPACEARTELMARLEA